MLMVLMKFPYAVPLANINLFLLTLNNKTFFFIFDIVPMSLLSSNFSTYHILLAIFDTFPVLFFSNLGNG